MQTCKVIDNLFDELFIQEISRRVSNIPVSPNNVAGERTYPYGLKGSSLIFGSTLFDRKSVNHINVLEPAAKIFFPILEKIENHLETKFYCKSIFLNVQCIGQDGAEHADSENKDDLTILQFTTANWKSDCGGEFELCNPKEVYDYVPGRIIVVPSHIPHRALAPTDSSLIRTSIAYRVKPLHKNNQYNYSYQ